MPTRKITWAKRGFLSYEQEQLSRLSAAGAKAPYVRALRRRRSSLNANRKRLGWSDIEYLRRVIQDYRRIGLVIKPGESLRAFFKRTFWDYFTWYKEHVPSDPEYTSPKPKRRRRVKGEKKAGATKRQMLNRKMSDNERKWIQAIQGGNLKRRRELERERRQIQRQLDKLG